MSLWLRCKQCNKLLHGRQRDWCSPVCKLAAHYERHPRTVELRRKYNVKAKYDLSAEEDIRLRSLGCAICDSFKHLSIDHDHKTGRVRAALCQRCNTRMQSVDDPEWLEKALAYKQRFASV